MKPYITSDNLETKTREWLDAVSAFNRPRASLDVEHTALLVIDMQKFFLAPDSPTFTEGGPAITPNIAKLIDIFRRAGRPVIFTRHVHHPEMLDIGIMGWWWDGACIDGTPESEICDELAPLPTEKVIDKHRYSAFYNTDLETVLRCMSIKDIVITGVMTNMCCESTTRDAYFRDYRTFFLADATGAVCEEMHVASLLNLAFGFSYICTTGDIIGDIKKK